MSFSNVNIGNRAGDHAGDPLRTAFNKINQNFYKISTGEVDITVNAPVTAVAGRTGNIVLTVDDITGAVSSGELDSLVDAAITGSNISLFTNDSSYATTTYVDTKFASTSGASQVYVDSQDAAVTAAWTANAATQSDQIISANTAMKSYVDAQDSAITTAWTANAATQQGLIDTLQSNAGVQADAIAGANAAIVTANTAMKGYVDAVTTAWTANAATQQGLITTLQGQVYSNTNVNTYLSTSTIGSLTTSGNLTVGGNLIVNGTTTTVSANTLVINDNIIYVANANPANSLDIGFAGHFNNGTYQHTGLVRQATTGQWKLFSNIAPEPGNTIDFTNAVYDPLQVGAITSVTIDAINANVTGANTAIVTANTAMKAYVDAQDSAITTAWTANAGAQANQIAGANAAIVTANTAMKAYVDAQDSAITTAWTANAATQLSQITGANTVVQTLQANIGSYYTWANANVAGLYNSILGANANAASQQTSINSINANIGGFYTYANTTFGTSSYANANVASYLPTYSGNVQALTVVGNLIAGTTPGTNYHNIRGNLVLGTANSVSASGDSVLTILGYGVTDTPIIGRAGVHYSAGVNYNATFLADSYGTGVSSFFGRHARGTNATPTAVQSGDTIGAIYFRGYGATGYTATGDAPGMYIVATENFTDSAQGTALILEATPVGAISSVPYVKLDSSGNVVVTTTTDSTSAATGALTVKGGIGVSGSIYTAGNITTLANVISPNFLFPNGVNILSTVTGGSGTYSNTNVAAYLSTDPTITTLQANIGSFYTYANATYNSGTTYSNSNVTAYLTTSNNIVIGNAVPVLYTSNAPTLQVGSVSSLRTDPLSTATSLSYNINYNSAGSPIAYRTGGVSQITLQGGVIYFNLLASTTANGSATMSQYGSISTSALTSYVPLALNASGGVTTNQSTFPLVNTTATTVNFAGAATTVNIGAANGNVNVAGSVVATGNVWAQGGYFRTSAGTAYIVNTTPTTVYLAGGATIGTYIGNASGITQLYGNVQGSTNGFAIGYRDIPQISFTGNTTIALSDAGKHYYSTSATNYTLTVANNASVAFSTGAAINIINQGTGTITIAPGVGVTMYMAGNSTSSTRTLASYGMATMQKVATDTWFVSGVGLA